MSLAALASPPVGPYPDHAESTETTITVHVLWLPSIKAVSALCGFIMGDTSGNIIGCYNPLTNTIIAAEPENFNDRFRLEILGHEFWHALGAEHPAL